MQNAYCHLLLLLKKKNDCGPESSNLDWELRVRPQGLNPTGISSMEKGGSSEGYYGTQTRFRGSLEILLYTR